MAIPNWNLSLVSFPERWDGKRGELHLSALVLPRANPLLPLAPRDAAFRGGEAFAFRTADSQPESPARPGRCYRRDSAWRPHAAQPGGAVPATGACISRRSSRFTSGAAAAPPQYTDPQVPAAELSQRICL
jgi:hypothetical protein